MRYLSMCAWIVVLVCLTTLTGCRPSEPVSPLPTPLAVVSVLPTPTDGIDWPGGKLLYHSNPNGIYQIYQWVEGGDSIELTHPPYNAIDPAWSPDGRQIAFSAYTTDPSNPSIYLMNADGSNIHHLMPGQPRRNWRPEWAPDGQYLLFQSNRDGNFEIYKVGPDGSGLVNLTNHPSNDGDPDWSPNGQKILFYSDRSGASGLYTMDVDGSNVVMLVSGAWQCFNPRWSPDGTRIAFASAKESSTSIYVANADGSHIQKATTRTLDNATPTWVGNDKIVFSGDDGGYNWDLYMVNADGSGLVQITSTRRAKETKWDRYPAWIP